MTTFRCIRPGALTLALIAAAAAPARSQMTIEAEAGPFVGGTFFLSNPAAQLEIERQQASPLHIQGGELRNSVAVGVHAGLRFANRIGLEGTYAWIPTTMRAASGLEAHGGVVDVSTMRYGLTTTYHFSPIGRVQPFAGGGISAETTSWGPHLAWERSTAVAGTIAAGGDLWVGDGVFLRMGAERDVLTQQDRRPQSKILLTAGLNLRQRIR